MQTEPIVQFVDVNKRYRFRTAVQGLNFSLQPGRIIGLIGANGSGKSTTLKLMAGLARPSRGRVYTCGAVADRLSSARVSYMSDGPALYPFYTAAQLINYFSRVYADFDATHACHMLDFMELQPNQPSGELSKGNFGRLKMVLALSRKAPLVLMDEPLSGLDPLARAAILKALLSFVDLSTQTLVMSTHEVAEIEPLLDAAMLMANGRVVDIQDIDALRTERGLSLLDWMAEEQRV